VRVVEVGDTSWTFLALPGHIAEGGTVTFQTVASEPQDGRSWVSVEVTAKGVGKGLEGAAPSAIQRFAGKDEWSMVVVNIHCNRTMFGKEPIAFC
jgi:hypothetical protein